MRLGVLLGPVALAAGCFGMCGPTVSHVESDIVLDVAFTPANETLLRTAMEEDGYAIDEPSPGILHGIRDGVALTVQRHFDGNGTDVSIRYGVPREEFGNEGQAQAYIDREAAKVQPHANATVQGLRDAVDAPPGPAPVVRGYMAVC